LEAWLWGLVAWGGVVLQEEEALTSAEVVWEEVVFGEKG